MNEVQPGCISLLLHSTSAFQGGKFAIWIKKKTLTLDQGKSDRHYLEFYQVPPTEEVIIGEGRIDLGR